MSELQPPDSSPEATFCWVISCPRRIEEPLVAHREMIGRRVRWIANAREVDRTEIMALRDTEGWASGFAAPSGLWELRMNRMSFHSSWCCGRTWAKS